MKNKIICLLIILLCSFNIHGQILYPFNKEKVFPPIVKVLSDEEKGIGIFITDVDSKKTYLASSLRIFLKNWDLKSEEFKDSIIWVEPYYSKIHDSLAVKYSNMFKDKDFGKFKFKIDLKKLNDENRILFHNEYDICLIDFSDLDASEGILETRDHYPFSPYYYRYLRTDSLEANSGICISMLLNEDIELNEIYAEYLWKDENLYYRKTDESYRFYCNTDNGDYFCQPVFMQTKKDNGLEYFELFGIVNKLNELWHIEIVSNLIKEKEKDQ